MRAVPRRAAFRGAVALCAVLAATSLVAAAGARPTSARLQVQITSAPPSVSTSSAASFGFAANEQATFTCSLDGARPTACASPASYDGLADGLHDFSVTARNTDASSRAYTAEARYRWRIELVTSPSPPAPPAPLPPPPLPPPPPASVPAREQIVFVGSDPDAEIWVMGADGSGATQLTHNAVVDTDPAWSPDGKRIAFTSNRDGDFEIFVMDGRGDATQLTHNASSDVGPTWSPDGKSIAFAGNRDGDYEIFVMKANGTSQQQLTSNGVDDLDPDWSPKGARIAFAGQVGRGGDREIELVKADGSVKAMVTSNEAEDTQPAWSPDGKTLAFTSDRDGDPEVFAMKSDGSSATQLTTGGATDRDPTWLSGVPAIGFASDRGGVSQLFTMTPSGGSQALLTDAISSARLPDWHWQPLFASTPDLPASFPHQAALNVSVEPHGHFVRVHIDQRYASDKTRVELWQGNDLTSLQTGSGAAKKTWDIQVDHLKPHKKYALWIVMKDPLHGGWQYQWISGVRTLQRNVDVIFETLHVLYDGDNPPNGCGEFFFVLHLGSLTMETAHDIEICSGEIKSAEMAFHLENVSKTQLSTWVWTSEDDNTLGIGGSNYNITTERILHFAPVAFSVDGEAFEKAFKVAALETDGGDPTFKWAGHYSVTYVKW